MYFPARIGSRPLAVTSPAVTDVAATWATSAATRRLASKG